MALRLYQENLVSGLAFGLRTKRKLVGQLATGGGKTRCFAEIAERFIKKNPTKDVLIIVHRDELLVNTRNTLFNEHGVTSTAIEAGVKFIEPARVYVAMVESMTSRVEKLLSKATIGLVVIDEAHVANFNKMHAHFPTQYILGFTATPKSSSNKEPLNKYYEDIVCGVDIPELIADGHLCQNITYAPEEVVDRLELAVSGNDFDERFMGSEFSRPKYITNTVAAYEKHSPGAKAMIYNVNVPHSIAVRDAFMAAGYDTKHIDGKTPKTERKEILKWFKTTPGAILCNVGIATIGYDEPTIETIIVNRATMSMPLWLQMCGRGSRPNDGKHMFTVIDMGGNAITHGDWNQPRDWKYIFHNPPRPGDGTGIAPMKDCKGCRAIIHAGARICPFCGYAFPEKSIPVEVDLHNFIVVTKNINVEEIMEIHKAKKEYAALYEIGRAIARDAKDNLETMSNEYANFILQNYFERAKEWMRTLNQRNPAGKKKIFNKWHQGNVQTLLFTELKKHFPEWQIPTTNQSAFTNE